MKRYKQKFRDMWLQMSEFRIWLRRDPEDSYKARCRFCKCLLNTKISELRSHAMTQKHMRKTSTLDIKRNDSSIDEEEPSYVYKRKAAKVKREKGDIGYHKNNIIKYSPVKAERSNAGPDYESLIESLALYEPEQALFANESTVQSDHQIDGKTSIGNVDEEMITNAVTSAVKKLKDSEQIFGDFVADRLRQLTEQTSEYTKDKIMQVILEASSLDRSSEIEIKDIELK